MYPNMCDKDNLRSYATNLLAYFCMPTLLKLKPSSLIHVNKDRINCLSDFHDILKDEVGYYHCCYAILFENEAMQILLIYQKELIIKVLTSRKHRQFLASRGYDIREVSISKVFSKIMQSYQNYMREITDGDVSKWPDKPSGFPHEIGLLLGYPINDVMDFIKYSGKNYILCGCWKVYHDAGRAQKIFASYYELRINALELLQKGYKLKEIKSLLIVK